MIDDRTCLIPEINNVTQRKKAQGKHLLMGKNTERFSKNHFSPPQNKNHIGEYL
jgi:hypothetical protein